jgi:hypothetical protein
MGKLDSNVTKRKVKMILKIYGFTWAWDQDL